MQHIGPQQPPYYSSQPAEEPSPAPTDSGSLTECPECGIDLSTVNARGHALTHWPERIPDYPQHAEAIKRQKQLYDLARERGE